MSLSDRLVSASQKLIVANMLQVASLGEAQATELKTQDPHLYRTEVVQDFCSAKSDSSQTVVFTEIRHTHSTQQNRNFNIRSVNEEKEYRWSEDLMPSGCVVETSEVSRVVSKSSNHKNFFGLRREKFTETSDTLKHHLLVLKDGKKINIDSLYEDFYSKIIPVSKNLDDHKYVSVDTRGIQHEHVEDVEAIKANNARVEKRLKAAMLKGSYAPEAQVALLEYARFCADWEKVSLSSAKDYELTSATKLFSFASDKKVAR